MYQKLQILSFVFNVCLGAFMFVFGEADDSPGAQLLGAIVVVTGVVGLVMLVRNRSTLPTPSENK
jgi:hypothetical protein